MYQILALPLGNRVNRHPFGLLEKEPSWELIKKNMAQWGHTGYPGIEEDVYSLTGGNPFYIISLFKENEYYIKKKGKPKSFHTKEEMEEVFLFEATADKGKIFDFWQEHFKENAQLLNNDPIGRKGLTYQILHYIAKESRPIYWQELQEKFELSLEEVEHKVKQLIEADFLEETNMGLIQIIPDQALLLALLTMKYSVLSENPTPASYKAEIEKILRQRLEKVHNKVTEVKEHVTEVEDHVVRLAKRVKTIEGFFSVAKGDKAEERVKESIRNREDIFAPYSISGDLESINIRSKENKKYQLDIVGILKNGEEKAGALAGEKGKEKRKALVVEVKDRKQKIYLSDAKKFVAAMKQLKKERRWNKVVGVYISASEFSKEALKYLKQHRVKIGRVKKVE